MTQISETLDPAALGGADTWYIGYLTDQLGGFGWGPTSMVEWLFEHIHVLGPTESIGASVMITALVIRLATLPLVRAASDMGAKARKVQHIVTPLRTEMQQAMREGDQVQMMRMRKKLQDVNREHGIKMRKLAYPFAQAFIGFGSWRLVRNMADLPIPGMETGGFAWFSNLCLADPYYILPACMAVTQHMMIRV